MTPEDEARKRDVLTDEQHAAYYDWRVKNGKPDSVNNREAWKAAWQAALASHPSAVSSGEALLVGYLVDNNFWRSYDKAKREAGNFEPLPLYVAPPPSPAVPGWMPIATAPKDGRAVVLCWAINADGKPIDWNDDPQTSGVFVQVASWVADHWNVYISTPADAVLHFEPTHWMPLPAPPKSRSAPDPLPGGLGGEFS